MRGIYKLVHEHPIATVFMLMLLMIIALNYGSIFIILLGPKLGEIIASVVVLGILLTTLVYGSIMDSRQHELDKEIKHMDTWRQKNADRAEHLHRGYHYFGNTVCYVAEDLPSGKLRNTLCLAYLEAGYLAEGHRHRVRIKAQNLLQELDNHGLINETILKALADWVFRQQIASNDSGLAELWFEQIRLFLVRLACITGDDDILNKFSIKTRRDTASRIKQEIDHNWVTQGLDDKQAFSARVQELIDHGAFVEVLVSNDQT